MKAAVAAQSSFPTQIRLWVLSALIMVLFVIAKLAMDRWFDPTNGIPPRVPSMTIQTDHPSVMGGEAAMLIDFLREALKKEPQTPIRVQFVGKETDLTVRFEVPSPGPAVKIDAMLIQLLEASYLLNDNPIDHAQLTERLSQYCEVAAISGSEPYIILVVERDVLVNRLVEFFEFSIEMGIPRYQMSAMSATFE